MMYLCFKKFLYQVSYASCNKKGFEEKLGENGKNESK
jgi:hypothetical protein